MVAGTTQSGNKGKAFKGATEIEIGHWTYEGNTDVHTYVSSKTGPKRRAVAGNGGGTGTLEGKRTTETPINTILVDGDYLTGMKLGFNDTTGLQGNAVVSRLGYDVNVDTGELQGWSCDFTADGEFTYY